ncbi:NAD-dependent protein deacylase [Rosenbergiella sp. S61]|uniref:NAD-dependent protein deacylase n=1 Tax=Rosenbergiella gaditana TaxID=2726987 RepID=A0ABS5ST97_9GAMM|nr:Sir2 family NAD+-dependent deacetylase [Rosenbergiella gaditana]MBT0723310.1 NAD-dependent protein deacylase [Rosenbergiella gaditana]
MRTSNRRRIRVARFKKNKRKMRQRFRQSYFEDARIAKLVTKPLPRVVVLTGAGISAESGIATFRAADGLWENHSIEDIATPEGYHRDPQRVHDFYNERRRQLQSAHILPNNAHRALAKLGTVLGDNLLVVTQNIDNLHERASSVNVIHMHGELLKARCTQSQQVITWLDDLQPTDRCTCCQFPAPLRPHVVWFGEMPLQMEGIYQAIAECDIFIAVGTSGQVYPAAGFVHEAKLQCAETIEFNLEPTASKEEFIEGHYGPASQTLPAWVEMFLSQR